MLSDLRHDGSDSSILTEDVLSSMMSYITTKIWIMYTDMMMALRS